MATPSKKHLTRDVDESLCHTENVKREDLIYSIKDWNKLPPSHQCKRCIKEKAKQKSLRIN
jgi:hypothetical protein